MGNYPVKHNNRKYPNKKKKRHYPKRNDNFPNVFTNNLVDNRNFGRNAREIRGYVLREVIVRDKYGNEKIMRERQFFNAGHQPGGMYIDD